MAWLDVLPLMAKVTLVLNPDELFLLYLLSHLFGYRESKTKEFFDNEFKVKLNLIQDSYFFI